VQGLLAKLNAVTVNFQLQLVTRQLTDTYNSVYVSNRMPLIAAITGHSMQTLKWLDSALWPPPDMLFVVWILD
jgi:hypothetical protein